MATLLLDLLTPGEEVLDEKTLHYRFDIPLLAQRMITATDWVNTQPATKDLHIGYFGASTGAAAAIVAATHRPRLIRAIVSRGGRPDLAGASLTSLWAPTLLIVGGADETVLAVNRESARKMCGPHDVKVVPGATHLFEEEGALDSVAQMASEWFREYLPAQPNQDLGDDWDHDMEDRYEHILEGSIVRGEDRNA
jgi:putative phosphoribosyl transferase